MARHSSGRGRARQSQGSPAGRQRPVGKPPADEAAVDKTPATEPPATEPPSTEPPGIEPPSDVVDEADLAETGVVDESAGLDADDEDDVDEDEDDEDLVEEDDFDEDETAQGRSTRADALWSDVRIDPIEVALPRGVGYTLRAYRPSTELAVPDLGEREDYLPSTPDDDENAPPPIDEEELTRLALASGGGRRGGTSSDVDEDDELDDAAPATGAEDAAGVDEQTDEAEDAAGVDEQTDEAEDAAGDEAAVESEDVPVFLTHRGRLLLFRSAESLVDFVRSDAEHDLTQLDTWNELTARLQPDDVVPQPEDTYELDLVVENLRGGSDAWDSGLLIQAGEVARDLGYALRIDSIIAALSPGSPLDNLDEALRAVEDGGIGSFFARRRARKIRAETAALGWRTIIGKISALTDWRD